MKAVLVDTGPIVALLDRSEQYHNECAQLVASLEAPLVTCEAVITEACYLLRNLRGAPAAVLQNVERGNFLTPYRVMGRSSALVKLQDKYVDIPMDFADACLVDLAGELDTARIFTLDGDFRVYRWGRNRTFEFVLNRQDRP